MGEQFYGPGFSSRLCSDMMGTKWKVLEIGSGVAVKKAEKIGQWAIVVAVLTVGTLATTSQAVASEGAGEFWRIGGVDAQTYRPAAGPGGLLTVEGADTAEHLQPYGGLFVDYLSNPLTLTHEDGSTQPIVDHRMDANMVLGIGAMDRFQFELAMPVVMVNRGEYTLTSVLKAGIPGLKLVVGYNLAKRRFRNGAYVQFREDEYTV